MKFDTEFLKTKLTEFVEQDIERIARNTKFVQRKSPLNGRKFLETVVFGYLENPEASLNDLAQTSADLGVEISAQGLDQRINEQALDFITQMFEHALEQFKRRMPLPIGLLNQFSGVYLTDSSVIALPDKLAKDYPGCGGSGPDATMKVQLTFEFLSNHLAQVVLRAGRNADRAYQDYVQVLQKGGLSITDLGYFSLTVFKSIVEDQEAYVLSRLDTTKTKLLTPEGAEIDLLILAQQCGDQAFEKHVLVGKSAKYRLPFRLLVAPVPQQVADQRRRKAKANASRKGCTVSKRHLALMDWCFFITNAPAVMLPLEAVLVLYRVRWQVELLFKLCKSYCGLKRVAGFRKERVLVELYGKLIGVVLTHFLLAPLRLPDGILDKREISPVKVRKIFRRFVRDLVRALVHEMNLEDVLSELLTHIKQFGFKQKRVKEPNLCHRLALVSAACGFESNKQA